MALIREIEESRDPNTDTRIEVPNIKVSAEPRVTEMPPELPEEVPQETPTPLDAAQQVLDIGDNGASQYTQAPEGFVEDAGPHDPNTINEMVQVGLSGDYAGYRDTVIRQRRWQNQMAMPQFPNELYRPDLHGRPPIPNNPSADQTTGQEGLTDEMFQNLSSLIMDADPGNSPGAQPTGALGGRLGGALTNVTERVATQSPTQTETPELYDRTDRTWAEKIFGFPTRLFMWAGDDVPTDLGDRNVLEDLAWRQNIVLPQIMSLPAVLGGALNRGLGHMLVNAPLIGDALVPEEQKDEFLNDVFYNTTRNLSALFSLGLATERRAGYEQSPLEMLLTDLSGAPGDAEFAPLQGSFGEAGRGVGGAVIYGLQTPDDAVRALGQDIYELITSSSGGTQSRRNNVEQSGGIGLNHLAQALTGTEHSFMSPGREDGKGMGWSPIVEGEVGINLPGGSDDTILSWLPGSGTATGFVLDALTELGVGTLLDSTAGAIKKSQPNTTTITRSLSPGEDGSVSVLRDPDSGNILPPSPIAGLLPPVRADDIMPLTDLRQVMPTPTLRRELGGSLAPVNRTTALDASALVYHNMDAELLGQQRRLLQGELDVLAQQRIEAQQQVFSTYQNQRTPLNIGTHESNTVAQRLAAVVDAGPLARQDARFATVDVNAVEVVDEVPNRTTPNASGTRLTRQERRAQSNAAQAAEVETLQEPDLDVDPNTGTQLKQDLTDKLQSTDRTDRSVTFFEQDGVESYLTPSYYADDTLVWAFDINGTFYADDVTPTPEIRSAVRSMYREWDTNVRPVLDEFIDEGVETTATAAAKTQEELLSKWKSYQRRGFYLTDVEDFTEYTRQNPRVDVENLQLVDYTTVDLPEDISPLTQQMMVYVGDRELPVYRAGTDEVVSYTNRAAEAPRPEPPAVTPRDEFVASPEITMAKANYYLGTKEADVGSIPTVVSPTSPTGNGFDLVTDPDRARVLAEAGLPPDALKRGGVSEQGRVIPVNFTVSKPFDMKVAMPDSIKARLTQYVSDTYGIDVNSNKLLSGMFRSGSSSEVLEAFDNAMKRAFGDDAPLESQSFRNVFDEALIEDGYDAKVSGEITTPLTPIRIDDPGEVVGTGSRYEQAAATQEAAQMYGDAASLADAAKARVEALDIAEESVTARMTELDAELEEVINSQVDAAWKLEEDLTEFEAMAERDAMDVFTDSDLVDLMDFDSVDNTIDGTWNCL